MSNDAQALYTNMLTYAAQLYAQDKCSYDVIEDLKAKGLSNELAEKISEQARELYQQALLKRANKNILYGSLWLAGGLLVTLISYSSGSGGYIITYGAIIGGLVQLISGLVQKSDV